MANTPGRAKPDESRQRLKGLLSALDAEQRALQGSGTYLAAYRVNALPSEAPPPGSDKSPFGDEAATAIRSHPHRQRKVLEEAEGGR